MRISSIRKRFKSAIERGTGEAHLLMKQYPDVDFSEEIIHAACHNLAYDPQCEYDRGKYVFELINLAPQKERIFKSVWAKLVAEKDDDYGLNQMYDIAVIAAKAGDNKARSALYKRFEKSAKSGWSKYGSDAIVYLDGFDGVLKVADLRGRMLLADPDDWEDSSLVDQFQEDNLGMDAWALLNSAGKRNKNIASYLRAVKENNQENPHNTGEPRSKRVPFTYESIRQYIDSNRRYPVFLAAKDLSEHDRRLLATDFLTERDPDKQSLYLWLFTKCRFPLAPKAVLQILKNGATGRLRYNAIETLSLIPHATIRKFFTEKIADKECLPIYFTAV